MNIEEKDFYTMEEVLDLSKELAIEIDERTFKYYLSLEIISKPVKNPYPQGDKRIKFYPARVIDELKRIFQLKNRGFSLKQIKKLFIEEKSKELDVLIDVTGKDEKREMAHAYLEALLGSESKIAWKEFLSASTSEVSEKTLLDALKLYLERMLSSWLRSDEAGKYVEEYLLDLDSDIREGVVDFFKKARDNEIMKHRAEKMDLLRFLQKLCGRVILGRYNRAEVEEWLNEVIANLEKLKCAYQEKAPQDTLSTEMNGLMLKGIELYLDSIHEIKENISSKRREILIAALGKARTAHNILSSLEEIAEKKKVLIGLAR
ncbi:MAG: MerR family transcriptional regulator [Candidatus Eremiobacteraeota bacterium]|nr:MerR family transcriptional regulator [Candidatus Eremiobacteraeota bacterium]